MYLIIRTSSAHVAGIGPEAWNRDHKTLQMYTPHHAEHHDTQREARRIKPVRLQTA